MNTIESTISMKDPLIKIEADEDISSTASPAAELLESGGTTIHASSSRLEEKVRKKSVGEDMNAPILTRRQKFYAIKLESTKENVESTCSPRTINAIKGGQKSAKSNPNQTGNVELDKNAPSVSLGLVENGIRAVSPCMPLSLDTATKNQVASAVIGRTIVTPTATDTKLCVQPNSQGVVVETEENLEAENHRLILASFTLEDNSLLQVVTHAKSASLRRHKSDFAKVVHKMVCEIDKEDPTLMRWVCDGEAFAIDPSHPGLGTVLRRFFHHSKYSSFQRQLNTYGWNKCRGGRYAGFFFNPFFRRDSPDDLARIYRKLSQKERNANVKPLSRKRRPNNRRQQRTPALEAKPRGAAFGTEAQPLSQLGKHKPTRPAKSSSVTKTKVENPSAPKQKCTPISSRWGKKALLVNKKPKRAKTRLSKTALHDKSNKMTGSTFAAVVKPRPNSTPFLPTGSREVSSAFLGVSPELNSAAMRLRETTDLPRYHGSAFLPIGTKTDCLAATASNAASSNDIQRHLHRESLTKPTPVSVTLAGKAIVCSPMNPCLSKRVKVGTQVEKEDESVPLPQVKVETPMETPPSQIPSEAPDSTCGSASPNHESLSKLSLPYSTTPSLCSPEFVDFLADLTRVLEL